MSKDPVLFISHGAPTFALEPGEAGRALGQVGAELDGLRAMVVISPHWQTDTLRVTTTASPETIHDFYGFPEPLYRLQYPAQGSPAVAQEVLDCMDRAGLAPVADPDRGLDHGVWVPMMHLRPKADIPLVCVSLPYRADATYAFQLGESLKTLRESGVAIIGSGSLTHNLGDFRGTHVDALLDYVEPFTDWVQQGVKQRDTAALLAWCELAPHARQAHPTEEHFLPLFVAMGASDTADELDLLTSEVRYGMLSMASFAWHAAV